MLYNEDMTSHAVIGEAAVRLALREQEITVDALLTELNVMLKNEKLSLRRISAAIGWLRDFRSMGARDGTAKGWMLPDVDSQSGGGKAIIRLYADDEDEIR